MPHGPPWQPIGAPLSPKWPPREPHGPQWDPIDAQWAPWAPNGFPMDLHGAQWAAHGRPWPPMGAQSNTGVLWGALGVPLGAFLDLMKIGHQFPSKWAPHTQPAIKQEPLGTHHSPPQRDTAQESTQEGLLRAPLLLAPGARMTVVELTLPIYQENIPIPTLDRSKPGQLFHNT